MKLSSRAIRRYPELAIRAVAVVAMFLLTSSCGTEANRFEPSQRFNGFPPYIIWAWERPEELEFLDPDRFGVAFLAQTLQLTGDSVVIQPRRQTLKVPPNARLIAVTRIESRKHSGERISLSDEQKDRAIQLILRTLELPNVAGIQIDFDVVVSERAFYRDLLSELQERMPENVPLSITALASFCLGDRWMEGLAIDEAVPMLFRMGDDGQEIKARLESGADLQEPLCKTSYGFSLDEPIDMKFDSSRRIYLFNPKPWNESDLQRISERFRR